MRARIQGLRSRMWALSFPEGSPNPRWVTSVKSINTDGIFKSFCSRPQSSMLELCSEPRLPMLGLCCARSQDRQCSSCTRIQGHRCSGCTRNRQCSNCAQSQGHQCLICARIPLLGVVRSLPETKRIYYFLVASTWSRRENPAGFQHAVLFSTVFSVDPGICWAQVPPVSLLYSLCWSSEGRQPVSSRETSQGVFQCNRQCQCTPGENVGHVSARCLYFIMNQEIKS